MRQKTRRTIVFVSLFFFPITMNFLSPYVPIDGALQGIVAGSLLVFLIQFLTGIFFGRAWCGWICPMAGLSDLCESVNGKSVPVRALRRFRYGIFSVWMTVLVTGFVFAGGIHGIDPLHLTEHGVSVDEPMKYIIYYFVLLLFFILTVALGKRGACHSVCWMAPFMAAGYHLGKIFHMPQLRIHGDDGLCRDCGRCNRVCPMGIDVREKVKNGGVYTSDCILCCQCVDTCHQHALSIKMKPTARTHDSHCKEENI